jgi:hypothetical protein
MRATLTLSGTERDLVRSYAKGRLSDEEVDTYPLPVSESTTQLNFELSWKADWGHYPPHDIDLIVLDPDGVPYFDGATLDIPERFTIDEPIDGDWTVMVTGFMLHGFDDRYELRITDQDGESLRARQRRRWRD